MNIQEIIEPEILLKLCLIMFMPISIGYNRAKIHQVAGIRTHLLVSIGALLSILISLETYEHM